MEKYSFSNVTETTLDCRLYFISLIPDIKQIEADFNNSVPLVLQLWRRHFPLLSSCQLLFLFEKTKKSAETVDSPQIHGHQIAEVTNVKSM